MNEQQTNHSEVHSNFPPEGTDANTNPFNGDQMGEFTSNFGTNTNAVSQIFREGQFSQNRSKIIAIAVAAVLIIGGGLYFFSGSDSTDDEFLVDETTESATADEDVFGDEDSTEDTAVTDEAATDTATTEDTAVTEAVEEAPVAEAELAPEMPTATNVPVLMEPADGASRAYDETSGSASFSWEGSPGGWIVFSRSPSMTPQTMRIRVEGNNYQFSHPWPGTWYWRVDNGAGSSEVRSFSIAGALRRNVVLAEPQENGTLSGNGGVVSWQGDSKIAYYKVEISNGSWANPMHKFATSGTQVQVQGVQPGQYQLRVGAFSEVAGRWEYTRPVAISVQ